MSLGFELAQAGSDNQYANALSDSKPVDQLSPGTFEGVGRGIASGVMRGGANVARAVSMAGSVLPIIADKIVGGTKQQDEYFATHDRVFNRASEYWTPRPDEVGSAGRVLGGVAEMALPLMAGGGNPTLLMGSAGIGGGEDLVRQGVDASTARGVGMVQAAAVGAGFKIPFLGRNLLERVAFGAGSNLAVGAGAAAISAGQLTKDGYAKQAEQFDALDPEARALDVLMGAVFGGIAHVTTPKGRQATRMAPDSEFARALDAMPETQRDALLTANNARHADVETAPGRPLTLDAANDHADALAQAMNELDAGQPVTAKVDPAMFAAAERYKLFTGALAKEVDAVRGKSLPDEAATPAEVAPHLPDEPPVAEIAALPTAEPAASSVDPALKPAGEKQEAPAAEISAAERAIASNPDLLITHDDGTVTRAADALARADEVIAQAKNESRAFEAAISCELSL